MIDPVKELLQKAVGLHKSGNYDEALTIYNRILNRSPFDEQLLYLVSDALLRKDLNALAIHVLCNLIQINSKNSNYWCNLGVGYRKENFYDEAKAAWLRGIEVGGKTIQLCNNLASLYADRGYPDDALRWLNDGLSIDPDNVEAKWEKGLALLSLSRWGEGWDHYEYRQKLENWHARFPNIPFWDFKPIDHLYIHGEQGIGDEVMFCSVIPDVLPLAKRITLELNKKVAPLAKLTWPQINVVTEPVLADYNAKIPLGSLCTHFRRDTNDFPGKPYLKPDPARVAFYRQELQKLGDPPYIALTWLGGVKQTRFEERTIELSLLKPIFGMFTCVSAQYSNTYPYVDEERLKNNLPKINDASCGDDLAEQAALFKACDAVITVQQTAVHVAGAVGTPTYALIPKNPHWRYGFQGESMPWYQSVRLFRNHTNCWENAVAEIYRALNADLRRIPELEQKAA